MDDETKKLLWDTLTSCRELLQGHSHNKPEAVHRIGGCVLCARQKSVCRNIDTLLSILKDPVRVGSVMDALDRIYEAGGKAWDNVPDPDAVLREMREDD